MKPLEAIFGSDLWMRALKSYGNVSHLTLQLFDDQARIALGPIHPTPLFRLFEENKYDPGIFAECARRCLAQTGSRPVLIVSQYYGLSVVGTSLALGHKIVGAAVGGYAFVDFSQVSEIQRLARDSGIRFERVWQVAREQKPVSQHRLILEGELLQVLGDTLLEENGRTRQYEETVLNLEEVARAKDQIDQDFRKQAERLHRVEKMAAAGQLASSFAHEINNPLSSVTNALYLLENHSNLEEVERSYLTTAVTELARLSRIVKQSLSYYHEGDIPVDVDLGVIVNECLQVFSEKFQRSGIEVKQRIGEVGMLIGFRDELRQAVDNLLLNALEAMPGGGSLSIRVHASSDWIHHRRKGDRRGIRLTIADSGCGIPKVNRSMIFEPFFSTKSQKGTGLGLWILLGILSKHEGVVSVRSSDIEGRSGTIISIFFPSHIRALENPRTPRLQSAA